MEILRKACMHACAHTQIFKNIESLLWEKILESILTPKAGLTPKAFSYCSGVLSFGGTRDGSLSPWMPESRF